MASAAGQVTIVGGGIAGLVAAISCAEDGRKVLLHEATGKLGGRGRSADGLYIAHHGPTLYMATACSIGGSPSRSCFRSSLAPAPRPQGFASTGG